MAQSDSASNAEKKAAEATVAVSAVDKETGGAAGSPQAVAVEIVEAQ